MMEIEQGGGVRVNLEHYIATASTIAAVRATKGLELLAEHRGAAMPAIAGVRVHDDVVDEAGHWLLP
jgi:predicted YcjX-like family ATPase